MTLRMNNKGGRPLIFDIRRFALEDGPGIRTVIFFKGCPLSCSWCQNPESISESEELLYYPDRCISCGECETCCPNDAVHPLAPVPINRDRCVACGECVKQCPANALRIAGKHYGIGELAELAIRDRHYYATSGGGITLSGGEPTRHLDFVTELARELKRHRLHLAIQTSGYFDLSAFASRLLPYLDTIYYDIKLIDPAQHKMHTGVDNDVILRNLGELARYAGGRIFVRVPLVPGITDQPGNLDGIRGYLAGIGIRTFEKLRFNPGGEHKRVQLGMRADQSADGA